MVTRGPRETAGLRSTDTTRYGPAATVEVTGSRQAKTGRSSSVTVGKER
ncbi:hypothetical protein E2C01_077867 [Portunus trituberculatus]|uniref:Uncharacterized protein n=1 Tax=Portunus trituberculatus TaxID=210409 RepID=A0A5B7ICI3_PORTR|nr:hypothetical protein [Portunus trituberculatus]